jgi:hypothetical protein
MKALLNARPRLLGFLSAVGMICFFAAATALHPGITADERATWKVRLADRRTYPDARLRDMEEAADPEMAALMKAELARRGSK